MAGVLGHDYALLAYTGPGATWTNKMNFAMNHSPGTGSIVGPVDQWSSALPLSYGCPQSDASLLLVIKHCNILSSYIVSTTSHTAQKYLEYHYNHQSAVSLKLFWS